MSPRWGSSLNIALLAGEYFAPPGLLTYRPLGLVTNRPSGAGAAKPGLFVLAHQPPAKIHTLALPPYISPHEARLSLYRAVACVLRVRKQPKRKPAL